MATKTIIVVEITNNGNIVPLPVEYTNTTSEHDLRKCLKHAVRRYMANPNSVHMFRLVGEYPYHEGPETQVLRVYGFTCGSKKPNSHELPPSAKFKGVENKLLFGSIVAVRVDTQTYTLLPLDVDTYETFLREVFAEESLGEVDSERSSSPYDNGSDLVDFIVSDSVCD